MGHARGWICVLGNGMGKKKKKSKQRPPLAYFTEGQLAPQKRTAYQKIFVVAIVIMIAASSHANVLKQQQLLQSR